MKISKIFCMFFLLILNKDLFADPAALYFDPGMMHSVFGINRYPTEDEEWSFDLSISPFYQHATGARDKYGDKVKIGDRLGHWKMLPMFWGEGANVALAPESKPFNGANYPALYAFNAKVATESMFPDDFDAGKGELEKHAAYSVDVDYEKAGLRLELDAALCGGFGFSVKTGAVEYKQVPLSYADQTSTGADGDVKTFVTTAVEVDGAELLLMDEYTRNTIATELGISLDRSETTVFEDTFAQLYWSNSFKYLDENNDHIVTVAPYVGLGVWCPTGKKKNIDRLFSLSTGHDGYWGGMIEGAINFSFPGTVLINIGGGATFFETKTQIERVPSHKDQTGIYPWKANVRRRFGTSWNLSASIIGFNIFDNFSVYCDYLYCKHEQDSITMKDTAERNPYFVPEKLEEESRWKSQMIQVGFDYHITPDLSLGVAGQTHISGRRVYKTHTILGSVTFSF